MLLARLPGWDYLKTSYRDNLVRKGRKLMLLVNQFQSQSRRCPRFTSTFCLSLCLTADNQFRLKSHIYCMLFSFPNCCGTFFRDLLYSGTPPYSHLGNTVTSLLRPFFFAAGKNDHTFSCKKKTLVNTVTRTARLFGPSGDRINGVPLYLKISYFSSTL